MLSTSADLREGVERGAYILADTAERVEEILPDVKAGWRQLRFSVLTVPRHEMTWILEPRQIDGDPFTMGGTPLRIERLPDPVPAGPGPDEPPEPPPGPGGGTVITFPGKGG